MKKLILIVAIFAMAVASQAQRGGGMMGMMGGGGGVNNLMLLGREDVQEDLNLTLDQKTKLAEFTDRQAMMSRFQKVMADSGMSFEDMRSEEGRKKMQPMMEKMQAEITKEVEAVMTPEQNTRLKQIALQFYGFRSVQNKDVAKALEITDGQKAKIEELNKKVGEARMALFQKIQSQEITREEMQEKMAKNDEILNAEIGKLLTDAQKAKFTEMSGKKFNKRDQ
jgi:hypothetical protein